MISNYREGDYRETGITVLLGDVRERILDIESESVQMAVTSPPYFGLRDYQVAGQIGLEETPEQYVAEMVTVFREVRRVLKDDGVAWLNLGDSYSSSPPGNKTIGVSGKSTLHGVNGESGAYRETLAAGHQTKRDTSKIQGLKPKDLIGIPWSVAFALRADGWYLRQDIIWAKPNPMPESVTDRCTKAHEYIFLLAKSDRYFYDHEAVAEPLAESSIFRLGQPTLASQIGSDRVPGKTNGNMKAVGGKIRTCSLKPDGEIDSRNVWDGASGLRNRRSVWNVTTQPFTGAHFATFPPDLIKPCIMAGSRPGDVVLDPFNGSGTTGEVSRDLGRRYMGIELNRDYIELTKRRLSQQVLFGVTP